LSAAAAARQAVPAQGAGDRPGDGDEQPVGRAAVGGACAIFDDRGRVLLVRHSYGARNWELPGGGSQPGETPDAAATRELAEETGLRAQPAGLAGVYFEPDEERLGPTVHFVFRFPGPDGAPVARPPEIEEVRFWPLDELPRPMWDFTERRIHDALLDGVSFAVVGKRRLL
jgi:ADP-ribose pyrophosphatase YjhB (NUDIX family)